MCDICTLTNLAAVMFVFWHVCTIRRALFIIPLGVTDWNARRKAFSKFYRRHSALVEKYNVGLKTLLLQDISGPEFYGDLVYRLRNLWENLTFRSNSKK